MPLLQPTRALRASRVLTSTSANAGVSARAFSSNTRTYAAASGHDAEHGSEGDHYEPPTGWLWGIKPGEKYEKEGWEGVWVWGFFGSLGLGVVAYAFKPDTSIQTWALEEARRRLEVEGILKEPSSKS